MKQNAALKMLAASIFALAALSGRSFAYIEALSVNFRGTETIGSSTGPGPSLDGSLVAGKIPLPEWNNTNTFSATNLNDSSHIGFLSSAGISVTLSGTSLSLMSANGPYNETPFPGTPNGAMMRGIAVQSGGGDHTPVSVDSNGVSTSNFKLTETVAGLAPSSSGVLYDLYTYHQVQYSADSFGAPMPLNIILTSGSATQYRYSLITNTFPTVDSFVEALQPVYNPSDKFAGRAESNYSAFLGVSATGSGTLSLELNNNGTNKSFPVGISGMQLITHTPTWTGANSSAWTAGGAQNWVQITTPASYTAGWYTRFDDTATSFSVTPSGATVAPGKITFDNTAHAYTLNAGTAISGSTTFTKLGYNNLNIVGTNNTFTGDVFLNEGSTTVKRLGSASSSVDPGSGESIAAAPGGLGESQNIYLGFYVDGNRPTSTLIYDAPAGSTEVSFRKFILRGTNPTINISQASTLSVRSFQTVQNPNSGFVKDGPGTLIFRGANTGNDSAHADIHVKGGTLVIDGSTDLNSYLIDSGAALGGSGTINTDTVDVSGSLAPGGANGGALTFLNSNVTLLLDQDVRIKARLSATASESSRVVIANTNGSIFYLGELTIELASIAPFTPTADMKFIVVDGVAGSDNSVDAPFGVALDYGTTGWSGGIVQYDSVNNDLYVTGLIPEPSSAAALLGGTAMLLGFARSRRRAG